MTSAFAQDPASYLSAFDSKIYSLKTKGVKDFVVDVESSKLTKQINDQQTFGKVEELLFRTYWTAEPERFAIEVIGLPDGFREVKEELKTSMLPIIENLLPQRMTQKFTGYKFTQGQNPKEILAQDSTGIATVPSFTLKFDEQDKLVRVIGNRPIGSLTVEPVYEKSSFAEGKWVLTSQKTVSSENGQTLTVQKDLDYGKSQGISVLSEVTITSEHRAGKDTKGVKSQETVDFKNYKINEGAAFKYFLGEGKAAPQPSATKTGR